MFPVEAFQRTIEKFVGIAGEIDLPFHITGGSVSSAYGEPRLTQNIDVVVAPKRAQQQVDALVDLLNVSDFLFTESVVRQGIASGQLFQLLDSVESLKLDVYPRELIPGELERSVTAELFEGVYLPIVSRTDAALSKLIWIEKGSLRSRRDLRSIVAHCNPDQQELIRAQAIEMGLGGLLEEVLTESDEIQ